MGFDSEQRQGAFQEPPEAVPTWLVGDAESARLASEPGSVMILALDGRTPLWSSHDVARRFGYRDAQSFLRARLPETAPGTRRLIDIGADAAPDQAARLERLRFFIGFRGVVLTALCRVIRLVNGDLALALVLPPPGGEIALPEPVARRDAADEAMRAAEQAAPALEDAAPKPASMPGSARPAADLIREARARLQDASDPPANAGIAGTEEPETGPDRAVLGPLAASAPFAAPIASPMGGLFSDPLSVLNLGRDSASEPAQTDLAEATPVAAEQAPEVAPIATPVWPKRFIFRLDPQGTILSVSPDAPVLAGLEPGVSLAETLTMIDPDLDGEIDEALALGETWHSVAIDWPDRAQTMTVPATLSALPLVDAAGTLTGFSGFVRLDPAAARPIAPQMSPAQSALAELPPAPDAADAHDVADDDIRTSDVAEHAGDGLSPGAFDGAAWADTEASGDWEADDIPVVEPDHADDAQEVTADALAEALRASTALLPDEPQPDIVEATDASSPMQTINTLHEPAEMAASNTPPELEDSTPDAQEDGQELETAGDIAADPEDTGTPASRITPFPLPGGRRKADPEGPTNVVSIHGGQPSPAMPGFQRQGLSNSERNAFREIAKALGARFAGGEESESITSPLSRADGIVEKGPPSEDMPQPRDADALAFGAPVAAVGAGEGMTGFLDRLPMGLLVLKGEQPLYANRTLLDLTAYPDFSTFLKENGARQIFRKGIAPREDRGTLDPMVLATRDGAMVPVDAQMQLVDWDGARATLIALRRAVELEQGKALRTVAQDLTRARTEINELRAILDTATDGVLTLDGKGTILTLNGTAEALFGVHQNEVVGEHFTRLLANESHAIAVDYLDGLKLGGVHSVLNESREVMGREKNGGKMPLFMTLGRISDDDPARFCAVLRDITAFKRAENDLTEARRVAELASAKKSDFLAKISHEIRTPMNAVIGFSEVMLEERLGPIGTPKYREYIADIRTSGQHVVSLVNDLLDLAKIEAGRMELDFQATDLNSIVQSAVQIIQPQANTARVLVRSQLAQKLPPVVADERSVRQIVLNILSNATRFTEGGGQVIVSTSLLDGGEAVIRIRDTGIGMSAAEIEQALEPFRQVSKKREKGGTGLGLPLTKALVEANRASFTIRSHPGEGTLVEVTFPATRVLAE